MEIWRYIFKPKEPVLSSIDAKRQAAIDSLLKEHFAGTITPETAQKICFFAIEGLGLGGDGWKAAEEALRIAFAPTGNQTKAGE